MCIYASIPTYKHVLKTQGGDINTEDLGSLNLGPINKLIVH